MGTKTKTPPHPNGSKPTPQANTTLESLTPAAAARSIPDSELSFTEAFPFPGVILVMGERGSGKTGLTFWLMDQYHTRSKQEIKGAVLKAPKPLRKLLPAWVETPGDILSLPQKAVVVIDEAQLVGHARRSASDSNLELANLVALSRQRRQLLILISHHSRKLDVLTVLDADRIVWKQPSYGHALFDRPEIRPFTARAIRAFEQVNGDPRKRAYVLDFHSLRFGMVSTSLPQWWKEEMSFSLASLGQTT